MQPLNAPSLLNEMESLLDRDGLSDPYQLVPLLTEMKTGRTHPPHRPQSRRSDFEEDREVGRAAQLRQTSLNTSACVLSNLFG
jgi:hypothetical protein